jgi:hypothetical protein
MVNGVDRNLMRLASCVSVYRAKYRAWPTHARLDPLVLWDIANHLEAAAFEALGGLMELRTQPQKTLIGISVGGSPGVVHYDEVDHDRIPAHAVEETSRWLPLDVPTWESTRKVSTRGKIPVVSAEEADFRVRDDGVTFHLRPTSEDGREWIRNHIDRELTPEGGIAVEPASIEAMIDDIEAGGLRFGPHEGEARVDFFPGESEDF